MSEIDKEKKIQRYLQRKLSPKEEASLEKQIQSDETLQTELLLQQTLRNDYLESKKAHFKRLSKENSLQPERPRLSVFRISKNYRLAAAIAVGLILAVLGGIIFTKKDNISLKQQLAIQLEESALNPSAFRIRNNEDNTIADWVQFFDNKAYNQAAQSLEALQSEGQSSSYQALFLGLSYLYDQQYPEAVNQLESIVASPDQPYQEESQWFLALAYLGAQNQAKAKAQLTSIVTSKSWRHQAAKDLLKAMK